MRGRSWIYVAAFAAVALAVVAAFLLIPRGGLVPGGRDDAPPAPSGPAVEHARWTVQIQPSGAINPVTKADRGQIQRHGAAIAGAVREVYDALLAGTGNAAAAVNKWFTPSAAEKFLRTRLLNPAVDAAPRLTKRVARIGVQAQSADTAAAAVTIRAVANVSGEQQRALHRAALYLERLDDGWRVVGFEIMQGPLDPPAAKERPKGKRDAKPRTEGRKPQRTDKRR